MLSGETSLNTKPNKLQITSDASVKIVLFTFVRSNLFGYVYPFFMIWSATWD